MSDTKLYALTDVDADLVKAAILHMKIDKQAETEILAALSTPVEQGDPLARLEAWMQSDMAQRCVRIFPVLYPNRFEVIVYTDETKRIGESDTLADAITVALDKVES